MNRDEVRSVLDTTLLVLRRVAERTRTQADDLMVGILRANQDRLLEAVIQLLEKPTQPPTDQDVAAALATVGIRV